MITLCRLCHRPEESVSWCKQAHECILFLERSENYNLEKICAEDDIKTDRFAKIIEERVPAEKGEKSKTRKSANVKCET